MKTLTQELSSIIINEVKPRLDRGGIYPNSEVFAFMVKLKHEEKISHRQLRQYLEAEMFKENWDKSLEEIDKLLH